MKDRIAKIRKKDDDAAYKKSISDSVRKEGFTASSITGNTERKTVNE